MLTALLRRWLAPRPRLPIRRVPLRKRSFQPRLECLEDRTVPSAVTWVSTTSGDWSTGANWSTGAAPTASDDVFINQAGVTVTHSSGNHTVHSLNVASGSDLLLSGGSLASSTTLRVDGTLEVSGGDVNLTNKTVDGAGTITNSAGSALSLLHTTVNPNLVNDGTLNARSGTELKGSFSNDNGATLSVVGDGTGSVGGQVLLVDHGFTNDGTIELSTTQPFYFNALGIASGTLVNASDGTIHTLTGGAGGSQINAPLDNEGTILADSDLNMNFQSNWSDVNNGTITIESGNVNFGGHDSTNTVTNNGAITIAAGQTLTVGINNIKFVENSGGSITGNGTFLLNRADATFSGDFATSGVSYTLQNSATYNSTGTLTVSPGDTLTLYRGAVINANLDNQGTILAQGVNNAINLGLSNDPGASLIVSGDPANFGSSLTLANDFTNDGLVELTSDNGAYAASLNLGTRFNQGDTRTFTNNPDGTFVVAPGTGGGRTLNANFDNQGILTVDSGATFTVFYGGLADLSNGTLSGGTYDIAGTLQAFNAAITTNAANLILDGPAARIVNMSFGSNALAGLSANAAGGSLTVKDGGTLALPAFTNSGSFEVDDTSHVTVNGTCTQADGTTFLNAGTLTATLINVQGGIVGGNGTLNGNVTNAGQIIAGIVSTPGVLTITGNFTQTSVGDLYLEIGGTNPGTDFGQLQVGGSANLDGTLSVVLTNSFTPSSGSTFKVLTFANESGTFATLDQDGPSFTPSYDATDVTLVAN